MNVWLLILVTFSVVTLLRATPPAGPPTFPVLSNFLWLRKSFAKLEAVLHSLHANHGPMVTLHMGPRPAVFITSTVLAHKALIHRGAIFTDHPPSLAADCILFANQHNINSTSYSPSWHLFHRNLTAKILHPSHVHSYSYACAWVLDILAHALFCLLVLMWFGDRLEQKQIKQIKDVQRPLLLGLRRFKVLNFLPRVSKLVLLKRGKELSKLCEYRNQVLVPLIRGRSKAKREQLNKAKEERNDGDWIVSYVDTLMDLELVEEKRKLEEDEMVSLCLEFPDAGTDTMSIAMQWIMANLVKYPEIQERLDDEIKSVVGQEAKQVKEEDLQGLYYLKAVVLVGAMPPPTGSLDPVVFKPERFLNYSETGAYDITGSREIKMMPFGYFMASFVWLFQWRTVADEEVDLSEKLELTAL
ncbi:hypothetical protein EUGRSUZ_H01142 [Eucalyptus grandis]|uniref:Uncharacterized protein n=2 Tax=Eucalyptus grandis TaxID=71139 RepID=A0ACC3JN60_EUCGR|nr:hypothetical protein EUGRSUZ_H01142 [Eucalyptus grandis]